MKRINNMQVLSPANFYVDANEHYQDLVKMKQKVEERFSKAPAGKIQIVTSKTRTQFYLREESSDRSGKYIRKSEEKTIRVLLQKAYDEKILQLLNDEIKHLETFQSKSYNISKRIQQIYSSYSAAVKTYIHPIDISDDDYVKEWSSEAFQGKEIPDYIPVYETNRGERVRSKSELNIANALAKHGIPYKYECPLTLRNGKVVYPDFTILDVKKREEIYWEHRGMMDSEDYASHAVFKVKAYFRSGILLGKNLIITEETTANPLGTNEIEAVIEGYFSPKIVLT